MNKSSMKLLFSGLISGLVLPVTLQAETITIGKGTGIVWEGMPFNETLSGPMKNNNLNPVFGLLGVSNYKSGCAPGNTLKTIAGYQALPFSGVSGVGLIPRSSGIATYTRKGGKVEQLTGTIGLPATKGSSSTESNITSPPNTVWCLPPEMAVKAEFYAPAGDRVATLSGTWVVVADGTQKTAQVSIPDMYFGSFSSVNAGDRSVQILPSSLTLRVSTLECNVNTPLTIDFGSVARNTKANTELALKTVPLVTTCGQASDFINANVNLQLRAISGLYGGEPTRLALNQGGGYITGEIDGGVTGSGACTSTNGARFDSKEIKLGNITTAQSSKTFSNQLTWRLCSGGASLPTGKVNASAEMLVTFN